VVGDQGRDDVADVAVQHPVQVVPGHGDPVVGDAILGEVVGPDLLGAIPRLHHGAALLRSLLVLAGLLDLQQAGLEHLEGLGLVLVLRLLVLADDHQPRGNVGDPRSGRR